MFSLESLLRSDSNDYTQYIIFNIKNKITLIFSTGTQERVGNSQGKRAIRVRAIEVSHNHVACVSATEGLSLSRNGLHSQLLVSLGM